ncbi:MAG: hypothetical protein KC561_17960, partial [Myxococcales bacterium]|nr:hypothetical protein [Myxococcales bacterium]
MIASHFTVTRLSTVSRLWLWSLLIANISLVVGCGSSSNLPDQLDMRSDDSASSSGSDSREELPPDLAQADSASDDQSSSGSQDTAGATDMVSGGENDSNTSTRDVLADLSGGDTWCRGYATRYWDCCKAHCGWSGNVPDGLQPSLSCDQSNTPQVENNQTSSCESAASDSAYTCFSMAPWAVSDTLSYGFAAVPAEGDICGRCYELQFDGTSFNAGNDPGSAALQDHRMVVQALNIGYDVENRQFDILTPGGGVGLFDACTTQWDVQSSEMGATYGGFLAQCKMDANYQGSHDDYKTCVLNRCSAVFDGPGMSDLLAGCQWFVNWFEVADNPNLRYREVACPDD